MTAPFHAFAARRQRRPRKRDEASVNLAYLSRVFEELARQPGKIAQVRANLDEYRQQRFLPRGFIRAIERCEWVLDLGEDIELLQRAVFEDSDTGRRLRQYPLLFKGICGAKDKP